MWAFLGDGEMGEPESLGAIGLAAREELDNLTFVINCNLQQLDGPVRGNGKVIQELESFFRGAGWNVIKVVWGRKWDDLLARDVDGALVNRMNTVPDGQFQTYSVESGAYIRENFFGGDARLRKLVEHLSDTDIELLPRGGHDYRKVYAAFKAAQDHVGQPTVILAHTVKGWTIEALEGKNATHQMKKLNAPALKQFRDRLELPISDKEIDDAYEADGSAPFYHPGEGSDVLEYLRDRRRELGGPVPERKVTAKPLKLPGDEMYAELKQGSGKQSIATTMAFVRLLRDLMKDPEIGQRIVPIAPDEYRTFGMDSMFSKNMIYNPHGQSYEAVDRKQLMAYKESTHGQLLHEGISEAGSMASATAAGSTYATHGLHMIPVYIFYSMFGFQRTGDSIWAMTDQLARGFLIGATAGRTTLTGEGLQHADGHSPLLAATNPAVVHYDPALAYEVSYIVQDGLRRMYGSTDEHPHGEDVVYYVTVYNEPYVQPGRAGEPRRGRACSRASTTSRPRRPGWRTTRRASSCWPAAWASRGSRRPSSCSPTSGAWPPTSGRSPRGTSSPATPSPPRSGTCSTREPSRGRRTSPTSSATSTARSSRSRTTWRRSRCRSPAGCRATTGCSAPTASVSPTPAPPRAATSTWTPSRSLSRPSKPWPTPAPSRGTSSPRRSRATASTTRPPCAA